MSGRDRRVVAAAVICLIRNSENKKKRKTRSVWMKSWLKRREELSHINLLQELKENNPEDFKNYLRMPEELFNTILGLITPLIEKQNTNFRKAITAHERLCVTLLYLATGRSYEDLKFTSTISAQALVHIIPETCDAIIKMLKKEFVEVRHK